MVFVNPKKMRRYGLRANPTQALRFLLHNGLRSSGCYAWCYATGAIDYVLRFQLRNGLRFPTTICREWTVPYATLLVLRSGLFSALCSATLYATPLVTSADVFEITCMTRTKYVLQFLIILNFAFCELNFLSAMNYDLTLQLVVVGPNSS